MRDCLDSGKEKVTVKLRLKIQMNCICQFWDLENCLVLDKPSLSGKPAS